MKQICTNNNHHIKGQGLLEVIVAIGIITASTVTTVALIINTMIVSNISQQQIIAINLAREGVEIVREIRDTNWLQVDAGIPNARWNAGLAEEDNKDYTAIPTFSQETGLWSVNFTADGFTNEATTLWIDNNGFYNQFQDSVPGSYNILRQYQRLLTLLPICRDSDENEEIAPDGQNCDYFGNPGDFIQVGVEVHSNVQWTEHGKIHTTQLVDTLFDWKT